MGTLVQKNGGLEMWTIVEILKKLDRFGVTPANFYQVTESSSDLDDYETIYAIAKTMIFQGYFAPTQDHFRAAGSMQDHMYDPVDAMMICHEYFPVEEIDTFWDYLEEIPFTDAELTAAFERGYYLVPILPVSINSLAQGSHWFTPPVLGKDAYWFAQYAFASQTAANAYWALMDIHMMEMPAQRREFFLRDTYSIDAEPLNGVRLPSAQELLFALLVDNNVQGFRGQPYGYEYLDRSSSSIETHIPKRRELDQKVFDFGVVISCDRTGWSISPIKHGDERGNLGVSWIKGSIPKDCHHG